MKKSPIKGHSFYKVFILPLSWLNTTPYHQYTLYFIFEIQVSTFPTHCSYWEVCLPNGGASCFGCGYRKVQWKNKRIHFPSSSSPLCEHFHHGDRLITEYCCACPWLKYWQHITDTEGLNQKLKVTQWVSVRTRIAVHEFLDPSPHTNSPKHARIKIQPPLPKIMRLF